MSAAFAGVKLTKAQMQRTIPKHGLTLDDVIFQIGSEELVLRMRQHGWLAPACAAPLLFDAGTVAMAWARILNGDVPPAKQPRNQKGPKE